MIYEEDVLEALLFAPDVQSYTSIAGANHMVIMLRTSKLIPYVRRVLNSVYGLPSRTAEYYHRYGDLIIHFVGDPYGRDPFNHYYWEDYGSDNPMFYVREKGERVGNKPMEVHYLIAKDWIPLVLSVMPESDAWLHISRTVEPVGRAYFMDSKTGAYATNDTPVDRRMTVSLEMFDWSEAHV